VDILTGGNVDDALAVESVAGISDPENLTSVAAQNLLKALGQLRSITLFRADFPMRRRSVESVTSARIARVKSSTSCDLVISPLPCLPLIPLGPPGVRNDYWQTASLRFEDNVAERVGCAGKYEYVCGRIGAAKSLPVR